jgi:hypothetical protein
MLSGGGGGVGGGETSFRFLLSGSQQLAFWTWKDSETYYKDAFDC